VEGMKGLGEEVSREGRWMGMGGKGGGVRRGEIGETRGGGYEGVVQERKRGRR
jgi:hypothetical protein